MGELEENHSGKAKLLESLQSELASVHAQQNQLEQEVGGRRDSLAAEERQLRVGTVFVCLTDLPDDFHCYHSFVLCRVRCRIRCP